MEVTPVDFATRLESLIGAKPVHAFAREVGVPDPTIRSCLRRRSVPRMDVVVKIASETGVSLEWLSTGNGPRYQADEDIRSRAVRLLDDPEVVKEIPRSAEGIQDSLEAVRNGKEPITALIISTLVQSLNATGMKRAAEWLLTGRPELTSDEPSELEIPIHPISPFAKIRRIKIDEDYAGRCRGHRELRGLISAGEIDPNQRKIDGVTLLMEAARGPVGDPDLVKILLDAGAYIHARDDSMNTALSLAILEQSAPIEHNLTIIALLLSYGADPLDQSLAFPTSNCIWYAKQTGMKWTLLLLEHALKERAYRNALGPDRLQ